MKSACEIKSKDVDVFMIDAAHSNQSQLVHTDDEGFTIESKGDSIHSGMYTVDIELKLDRVCKKLQVWCVARTSYGIMKSRSVEFSAHNNGKASSKVKNEEPESQSESSSSSSAREASKDFMILEIFISYIF